MKVIEGRYGAESPFEMSHDPKLHSLDCFGVEDEGGVEQLEVQ